MSPREGGTFKYNHDYQSERSTSRHIGLVVDTHSNIWHQSDLELRTNASETLVWKILWNPMSLML